MDEPFRQQLFSIYTASAHTYVDGYTTCALPCLNAKHFAAKTYGKGQHALERFVLAVWSYQTKLRDYFLCKTSTKVRQKVVKLLIFRSQVVLSSS